LCPLGAEEVLRGELRKELEGLTHDQLHVIRVELMHGLHVRLGKMEKRYREISGLWDITTTREETLLEKEIKRERMRIEFANDASVSLFDIERRVIEHLGCSDANPEY
jgi:hypothetical protein